MLYVFDRAADCFGVVWHRRCFLTNERLQAQLYRFRHWIDRGAGIVLIYIAFKIGLADITAPLP
ncbi:MAG: hypothetical protein H6925_03850 [Holosporaceae bacterium]|nr:MAG: hypothetical protein H6925_03850 [Holosporaceae bacterium]